MNLVRPLSRAPCGSQLVTDKAFPFPQAAARKRVAQSRQPMASLSKHIKRLLPRAWRRKLAEAAAAKEAAEHLDPALARASLGAVDDEWRGRIDAVVACSDNAHIPRMADAGELRDGKIVMHNGLLVGALGYYGGGILNMLVENRGVHEPQEERAFAEVLRHLPPGGAMIELGAYWGFYSMWFLKACPGGKALLVEPDAKHLLSGRQNFEMNGLTGGFEAGYAGKQAGIARDGTPMTTLDDLVRRHGIERVTILHSDIQGAELDMLEGGSETFRKRLVDHVFISTHSNELHQACLDKLRSFGFEILVSCDLEATVSYDGVIVAKRADLEFPKSIEVEGNRLDA